MLLVPDLAASDSSNSDDTMNDSSSVQSNVFWRWRRPRSGNGTVADRTSTTGTAADAIAALFGDIEVSDVELKGSDGGSVFAVKAILASRSTMFRQRFFSESAKDLIIPGEKLVVKFKHWDCRILHMIVEYCYTDECSLLKVQPSDEVARLVGQLRVASKAFKLPGLLEVIQQWGWRNINRFPALSCPLIDEGMRLDDIDELAMQTLQLKPRNALLPEFSSVGSGVLALTKPGLLFILRTLEDTTSHLLLLQVIERWVDFSSEDSNDESPSRERAAREAFGRKCALRFVKSNKINPASFERAMKNSRLFQKRDDLAKNSALLDEGIKFSEKSFKVEKGQQGTDSPERRPHTALGLIKPNSTSTPQPSIQPNVSQ